MTKVRIRERLKSLFLEWENYLTINRFAHDHGISEVDAKMLTQLGKRYHIEDKDTQ